MKALVGFLGALLVFASFDAAACPFQITATPRPGGQSYEVRWTDVPGATRYRIFEGHTGDGGGLRFVRTIEPDGEQLRFVASPSSTARHQYEYLIVAEGANGAACVATKSFELPGDSSLAAMTHKRVIPFAGSARGANGSDFRTALTVRFLANASGRIVFRPLGTLPSNSDPSIPYAFGVPGPGGGADLHFDDIIQAMGTSGVGTIEIIPAPTNDEIIQVPDAYAHIYNVTAQGTFGTHVPAVEPSDYVRDGQSQTLVIPPVTGNYRRNAGFRTLTETRYRVVVTQPGTTGTATALRDVPANMTVFGSVEDLFGGSVPADARVTIQVFFGNAIAFYTETENTTNDPTLVVNEPRGRLSNDVSWSY